MDHQQQNQERFNLRTIFQSILDNFNVNKGFIKTYRLLTTQPGQSIRNFLLGDRNLLTKPFQLLVVSTAIVAFFTIKLLPSDEFVRGFEEGYNQTAHELPLSMEEKEKNQEKIKELNAKISDMLNRYFNLLILLSIPFLSLATYWFFKKCGYNYAEHIVFNSYILSYQNLIYLLLMPLTFGISIHFNWLYFLIAYGYFFYVCIRFFELKFWLATGRAFLSLLVGTFMYVLAFSVVVSLLLSFMV